MEARCNSLWNCVAGWALAQRRTFERGTKTNYKSYFPIINALSFCDKLYFSASRGNYKLSPMCRSSSVVLIVCLD